MLGEIKSPACVEYLGSFYKDGHLFVNKYKHDTFIFSQRKRVNGIFLIRRSLWSTLMEVPSAVSSLSLAIILFSLVHYEFYGNVTFFLTL